MYTAKQQIVEQVMGFAAVKRIPVDQICVGGGVAMVMWGLRESSADLNLWIDDPFFSDYARSRNVINHPLVDTCIHPEKDENIWVRQWNRYLEVEVIEGIQVYTPLSLLIHKRRGYNEPQRPAAKRAQDLIDIRLLNAILAEKNKVCA